MSSNEIAVMFRWPRLPTIVLSSEGLMAASDREHLVGILRDLPRSQSTWDVKIIDPTGWEFWFDTQKRILAPGLGPKRRTKRQLVDLYNGRLAPGESRYDGGSLHNARLERIAADVASLLVARSRSRSHRNC